MFKALHRRLSWLYTVTTGIILILVIIGMLLFLKDMEERKQLEQFQSNWLTVSTRVQYDTSVSHSWLARTEAENRLIIHIEENKESLLYNGSWEPQTDRDILIERADTLAREQGVFMSTAPVSSFAHQTSLMVVNGDRQDRYYAMVMSVSTAKGVKSVCFLSYIVPGIALVKRSALFLGLLAFFGIIALYIVSWYFVGWSLRPAEESQKKQAEFIASASHELRSPLAVLRSGIAAIHAAPEEKSEILGYMDKECRRMGRLVSDMLLLASADAKTWTVQMERTELDTLLINTYEMFLPYCRDKGVKLQLHIPEYVQVPIEADAERLTQVLIILLDNALRFTPTGSGIDICMFQHPPSGHQRFFGDGKMDTVIEIRDQGSGISDSIKPHIFDRFYQGDASRTDKQHFGLGLSIAYELIRLHQGAITVSDREGGGSIFRITL